MTAKTRILDHMTTHGSITQQEAMQLYGCMRLGARIYDLRREGHRIDRIMETGRNRYGEAVTYARYRLAGGELHG